jgi:hypothetical protein
MSKDTSNTTLPATMTQADFEAVAEHCYKVASPIVIGGETVESILIMGRVRDDELFFTSGGLVPIQSDGDKHRITALMEAMVEHPEVDFVVHITEAWTLLNPKLPKGSIAKHPQRQEAVLFNILSKDCQTVVINPLHRNPSRLERGKVDFELQFKGRMVRETPPRN